MEIDLKKVSLIPAEKNNEDHKKGVRKVFNENIEFFHLTSEPVPYENHSRWWAGAFNKEFIFIISYQSEICGYIRLTKERTNIKEKHEISIAVLKKYQKSGIGTYIYKIFEKEMKKLGVSEIISYIDMNNEAGQKFFEKNNFKRSYIRYLKKL